jgi:hypothetical protein
MFLAAVLLADSQDKELSDRCKFIVEEVHSQDWIGYTNVKDVLRYLEYSGFYPMWLRSWIENEGHLQRRRRLQE